MERNTVQGVTGNTGNNLINLIRTIALKVLKKSMKRVPKEWVAEVASSTPSVSPNSFADVYINGDTSQSTINVKNKSWETLVTSDEVYLHSPSGSLNDVIILYKK